MKKTILFAGLLVTTMSIAGVSGVITTPEATSVANKGLVMFHTDGDNKASYKAIIKSGKLIITTKSDNGSGAYKSFTYETDRPDDVTGKNIKQSFNDNILVLEF